MFNIKSSVQEKKGIAHAMFDWLWDSHTLANCGVFIDRDVAYMFLAFFLCLPEEEAHMSKIEDEEYLDLIIGGLKPESWVKTLKPLTRRKRAEYMTKAVEKWVKLIRYKFHFRFLFVQTKLLQLYRLL